MNKFPPSKTPGGTVVDRIERIDGIDLIDSFTHNPGLPAAV